MLIDRKGAKHKILACEIEEICGKIGKVKIGHLVHSFPSLKEEDVARCGWKIELLVRMEYSSLHPQRTDTHDGLCLYKSQFGIEKMLGGTHQLIQGESPEFSTAVSCHIQGKVRNTFVSHGCTGVNRGIDFFSADEFGANVPPRCAKCKGCKVCRYETQQLSQIDQRQLTVIKINLHLNPVKNAWTTQYPAILENNYNQAHAYLERTEKRLKRSAVAIKNYCDQFKDFIQRGVIREITKEEQTAYEVPVFYLIHHEVMKEDSTSTPCRLVVNSSLKFKGVTLNDILMKGPNSLSDLFGIQLKFRKLKIALVCDIKKMYHSIFTTELEKNIRRILWQDMDTTIEPKVYGFEVATFGDKPVACIADLAVNDTAETHAEIDPVAAQRIKEDKFVDDIATGAETREKIENLKSSITEILKKGGFNIKGLESSGDTAADALALLGSGEVRMEPDLKYEEIPKLLEIRFTEILILSIVCSCYDPLGLICVITVQLKIELRKLYGKDKKVGWDDALPRDVVERWIALRQLLKKAECITFEQCIKPQGAIRDSSLILFNDGLSEAMCVIAYVRWQMEFGKPKSILWTAKTKVKPLRKSTIPRIEMQSAVMSTRQRKAIETHTEMEFDRVIHIVDSTCTMALINNNTSALGEYMGNKVTEILDTAKPDEFYHVSSKTNIADLGTRCNASTEDIVPDSGVAQLG